MENKKGTLEVIVGCMSSGKSEELIRRLRRASIAKQPVLVFKPGIDERGGKLVISSRDGKLFDAIPIDHPQDVYRHLRMEHKVIAFDEAQFMPEGVLVIIRDLVDRGMRVLVAGLDTDFRGEPFGSIPHMLAEADSVTKLTAVCVRCGEAAVRTQRLIAGEPAPYDSPRIVVGGDEMYEARCRACHAVPRT